MAGLYAAVLGGYFLTFHRWFEEPELTRATAAAGRAECWPTFPGCEGAHVLATPPDGYSLGIVHVALLALVLVAAGAGLARRWHLAHALLLVLFLVKAAVYFVFTMAYTKNYHHEHLAFSAVLLFLPHKRYFLRVVVAFFYLLAATIKIHPGWILGTVFTSMKLGMPFWPDGWSPLVTNLVILGETAGALLLFSARPLRRRLALGFFVAFHLYSIVLIRYMFPAMVLPVLLLCFGPVEAPPAPSGPSAVPGWLLVLALLLGQSAPFFIRGDQKLTLEGAKLGLYLFDANHQCVSEAVFSYRDGHQRTWRVESPNGSDRCDPYAKWLRLQAACRRDGAVLDRVEWRFDHSINGGPFYRLVDTADACALRWRVFGHNEWIRLPEEGAPPVGHAVENLYP